LKGGDITIRRRHDKAAASSCNLDGHSGQTRSTLEIRGDSPRRLRRWWATRAEPKEIKHLLLFGPVSCELSSVSSSFRKSAVYGHRRPVFPRINKHGNQ